MNLKLNKIQKCFKILVELKSKKFFQASNISRSSSSDFALNASQNFPKDIFFLSNLTTPKIILKNSDDKHDDDDDDDDEEEEVSQIILTNKFVKLCKFTSQSV